MCRIRCSPPGNLGNHTGRLAVYKPFTGSPKVLLITTQGRPTHLTCGQTIMRIIIPRPRSWRKGKLHPLSGQNASLKTKSNSRHPIKGRQLLLWFVMALFPASLAQAGMYPHGWYSLFKLQGERFFFPVRPIAHEKDWNITQVKNIFLVFSQAVNSHIDSILIHSKSRRYFPAAVSVHFHEKNFKSKLVHRM